MADVLFTHSYFLRLDPKEHAAMMPYPPLGTLYAAAMARAHGYAVALADSMLAESEDELHEALRRHRPSVVVIYDDDFNYLTKMCLSRMRQAAFRLAAIAHQSGCRVIVHGSDAGDHLEEYFTHDVEYVILGEGEQTLVELLGLLLRHQGTRESIAGLAYTAQGMVQRTAPRELMRDLDALPFPARDLIDTERYRNIWNRRHGLFSVNIVTTRGCPFHCNWCAKPLYGQIYHSRSPENVAREMEILKETVRPDHLWFCDDIFGLTPGWVASFSEEVAKRNAHIPFKCLSRVDLLLKGDTITHLQRAGCRTVWVGAESGSQKILDAMEKGTTVEQIYAASRALKRAGIQVGFFLQYGYPGETLQDIARTLDMVRECRPDELGISVSYPLPGTKFYDRVRSQLSEKQNWHDSQDLAMLFQGTFVPDFYRELHRLTHKRFRLWQGIDMLRATGLRPWHMNPHIMHRIAAAAYHWSTLPRTEARLRTLARQSKQGPAIP